MQRKWPSFELLESRQGAAWGGKLYPLQKGYCVRLLWSAAPGARPYVYLVDPPLTPRPGKTFEEIPHLMFNDKRPELSGLCLFDPDGGEWDHTMFVADTTIPWAAEWLKFYELWHYDGVWRGRSIGYENVAEARAAAVHESQSRNEAQ